MPVGPFRTYTHPVNIRDLDRFDAGDEVTPESLVEKGLLKNTKIDVKLLGSGEISKKLTVRVHAISATRAREDRGGRRHRRAAPRAEGQEAEAPRAGAPAAASPKTGRRGGRRSGPARARRRGPRAPTMRNPEA